MEGSRKPGKPAGVTFGNVAGGIHGSIIAGGDVSHSSAEVSLAPPGNAAELKQLLLDIHQAVAALSAQQDALRAISPSAAAAVQGAELNIKDVADRMNGDLKAEDAPTVQSRLSEASTFLAGVLKACAQVGEAAKPLVDTLGPVVQKLGVAAASIAKVWIPI